MGQPRYLTGGHGEGADPITDPWGMESFSKQLFSVALDGPQDSNRESFVLTPRSPGVCGEGKPPLKENLLVQ